MLVREPRPEPIPGKIGVLFSDEFRGFLYERRQGPPGEPPRGIGVPLVIGEPSVGLIREALGLLFSNVVEVSSVEAEGDHVGVIVPSIFSVDYTVLRTRVEVVYRFTLHRPSGEPVASWSITGVGLSPRLDDFGLALVSDRVRQCLALSMRDAAWNFTSGFSEQPAVRRWLEEHGLR